MSNKIDFVFWVGLALVFTGLNSRAQTAQVVAAGAEITVESCGVIGNGAMDPEETVTVAFALRNDGTADTTNVVATLLTTGGVTSPDGP